MGALWQAKRIYLGILESQSKTFRPWIFLQRILTAPMRSLMVGAGQPLAHERNLSWNSRIAIRNFPTRDFLEIEFHCAQARSLKCRSGHDPSSMRTAPDALRDPSDSDSDPSRRLNGPWIRCAPPQVECLPRGSKCPPTQPLRVGVLLSVGAAQARAAGEMENPTRVLHFALAYIKAFLYFLKRKRF